MGHTCLLGHFPSFYAKLTCKAIIIAKIDHTCMRNFYLSYAVASESVRKPYIKIQLLTIVLLDTT